MKKLLSSLAFAAATVIGGTASAAIVTFDPADEQGATVDAGGTITAQGFVITQVSAPPTTLIAADLVGSFASNGTPSLYAANNASLRLTSGNGGGSFNLLSLEAGGGNLAFLDPNNAGLVEPWAPMVQIVGTFFDGTVLTESFSIDQSSPGLALVAVNWLNLVDVQFSAVGDFSLDNLNLQGVPEPQALALFAAALAASAIATVRRRRRDI